MQPSTCFVLYFDYVPIFLDVQLKNHLDIATRKGHFDSFFIVCSHSVAFRKWF